MFLELYLFQGHFSLWSYSENKGKFISIINDQNSVKDVNMNLERKQFSYKPTV